MTNERTGIEPVKSVPDEVLATAPQTAWRPTVEDIVSNATAASEEARRRIAAQSQDASALDTKTAALITIASGLFGLAVTRINISTAPQWVSSGTAFLYFAVMLVCCFQAIRPRDDFAYGAHPPFVAALVVDYPHWSVMQQLAITLGAASDQNRKFLGKKQTWYERAVVTTPFIAAGVAMMAYTGAL